MKRLLACALVIISWVPAQTKAGAVDPAPIRLETLSGKVYEGVKITRVLAEGLVLTHAGGIVTVPFSDLSPEIQVKYGYDPAVAAASVAARKSAEKARAAAEAARRERAAREMAAAEESEAAAEKIPKIVSSQQMKHFWINTFPQPSSLDSDFHQKKREHADLMEAIRNGDLDDDAQRSAHLHNIKEYQRTGQDDQAASEQAALEALEETIAEKKRLAELQGLREEIERLRRSIDQLRSANL